MKNISPSFERNKASRDIDIDKFNGEKFNPSKFKLEMKLVFVDLWNIVDKFEGVPSSNVCGRLLADASEK